MNNSFTSIMRLAANQYRKILISFTAKTLSGLLLILVLFSTARAQEGTKQFMPNSTDRMYVRIDPFAKYNAGTHQRLNIYLNAGEKIHFGMQLSNGSGVKFRIKDPSDAIVFAETSVPTSAGTGYISAYTQAVSGANGTKLNGVTITAGYPTPFTYTAASTGNHYIEFDGDSAAELRYFDVTVTDASNNIVTNPDNPNKSAGRLWSQQWSFSTTNFNLFPVNAEFYVFTADEFVNKVKYEMKPFVFDFVANSFGTSVDGEQILRQQSQPKNVLSTTNISEYKIFLNDPDQTAFPTNNIPPPVVKAWLGSTQLYDYDYTRTPQQLDLSANTPTVTKNTGSCSSPSSAIFTIESNIAGKATILIDANGDGFVVGTNDRALYLDISVGTNKLVWDLKDANDNLLTDGNFKASATFLARGPAHFPLYDVESLSGITTSSVRPYSKLDPTLYWDDSKITDWEDKSGTNAMAVTTKTQLVINSKTPRVWTYSGTSSERNNGNWHTMNSWFNAIDLGLSSFNYTVETSGSQCDNGALPLVGNISKSGPKNTDITFTTGDFTGKYSDPGSVALNKIQILSLPSGAEGILKLSGAAININDEISLANLGNVTFTPTNDYTGSFSLSWNASNGSNFAATPGNINIAINTAPTISSIGNKTICSDATTGDLPFTIGDAETDPALLTVTASSSNLAIVPAANIVLGGSGANRTIKVTPATGVSGSATITIFVNDGSSTTYTSFIVTAGPSSNFTGSTSACVGSALTLIADEVGATSYSWKKGSVEVATTQTFSIANMATSNEGAYTLTVTNGSCTSTKAFTLSVFPHVTFSGATNVCAGATLTLTANESVATSYSWKKNGVEVSTSQTLTIANMQAANAGTDYTLTVTKEGCTNTSSNFTVSVTTGPTATIENGATANYCAGSNVTLTATAVSGATYQWKKDGAEIASATGQTYDASSAGTYSVVVTTTCPVTSGNVVVSEISAPTATIENGATASYCTGNDVTLTATAVNKATYQWKKNGADISGATGQTYDASEAGSYTVAVTTSCTTVSSAVEVSQTVIPTFEITNGSTVTFCGNSGTLTATSIAGAAYQWKKDGADISKATNNELTVTEAGTYTVTVTMASCSETSGNSTVTFSTVPVSSVTITSDATNNQICAGSNITFSAAATNGGTNPAYQWQVNGINIAGATQNIFTSNTLNNGDAVNVVMTASLACAQPVSATEIVVTVNSLPTVTFAGAGVNVENNKVTIKEGESVSISLSGAASYVWTPTTDVSSSNNGADVVLSPSATITYAITATSAAGCTNNGTDTLQVVVIPDTGIFIPSLFSPNGDGSNDRFIIRGAGIQKITFRVFDRSGHLIYETTSLEEATTSGWDGTKNGVNQPIGMYTWSVTGSFIDGSKLSFNGANAGKINLLR